MKILGRDLSFARVKQLLYPVDNRGWWPLGGRVREPYAGAWQGNVEWTVDSVLANFAVFACITRIAQDVSKLRYMLVQLTDDGIWQETDSPAFSPFLKKPNGFQNHIQYKESWIISKLVRGNTYALKQRDNRGVVVASFVLDPNRVTPLVTEEGDVYYRLNDDHLSGVRSEGITVPASEIMHDRINCLFHPLVGISPLFAAGCAADQGLQIQKNSSSFFMNGSTPGGVLIAPGEIRKENADSLKQYWNDNYTGANAGKVAVLGDGLKYEPLRMTAVDSQLIEQLKWSAEVVCSCFHVPAHMVGIGILPTQTNIEALAIQYYSQCLQIHIEAMECCLDEGLGLDTLKDGKRLGVALDLEGLARMDTTSKTKAAADAVGAGFMTPNEARRKFDMAPVKGGDTPYLQQQEFSLAALAERDAAKPFAKPTAPPPAAPAQAAPVPAPSDQAANDAVAMELADHITKGLECEAM